MVRAVLIDQSTVSGLILLGLALYLLSTSVSSDFTVLYIFTFFRYFSFWWAESGRIGPWPGWLTIVFQCYDTVGWVIWPVKLSPKMTYNVSSVMLNSIMLILTWTYSRLATGRVLLSVTLVRVELGNLLIIKLIILPLFWIFFNGDETIACVFIVWTIHAGWPLVWKTWKCQGIWQLSAKCQGFY